jgi:hypothetical protein
MSASLLVIASDIGPMREVLDNGRYGRLVVEPHVVSHWATAMTIEHGRFVANDMKSPYEPLEPERYSIESWCSDMRQIVVKWKRGERPGSPRRR